MGAHPMNPKLANMLFEDEFSEEDFIEDEEEEFWLFLIDVFSVSDIYNNHN